MLVTADSITYPIGTAIKLDRNKKAVPLNRHHFVCGWDTVYEALGIMMQAYSMCRVRVLEFEVGRILCTGTGVPRS